MSTLYLEEMEDLFAEIEMDSLKDDVIDKEQGQIKIALQNGGKGALVIKEHYVGMAFKANGIIATENAIGLGGKQLVIANKPSEVRIDGFWVFNDVLETGLPSSIYTPIPVLNFKAPDTVSNIAEMLSGLMSI